MVTEMQPCRSENLLLFGFHFIRSCRDRCLGPFDFLRRGFDAGDHYLLKRFAIERVDVERLRYDRKIAGTKLGDIEHVIDQEREPRDLAFVIRAQLLQPIGGEIREIAFFDRWIVRSCA